MIFPFCDRSMRFPEPPQPIPGLNLMTNEEKRLLSEFLNQLSNIRGVTRHPEADSLIRQAASTQPDALY